MLKLAPTASALVLFAGIYAQAGQWDIDHTHSSVNFTVRHMVVSKVSGNFSDFDGTIEMEATPEGGINLAGAKATIAIKATSISTDNQKRDDHLRSADFFDAANHPELTFVSTKVVPGEGNKFALVGNLTIRGVTKEVTFEGEMNGVINDPWGNTRAGFSATATINRQDFGVSWSKMIDNGGLVVSDEVEITVELELVQEKPQVQG